jgi:signal transduction histidine kinase
MSAATVFGARTRDLFAVRCRSSKPQRSLLTAPLIPLYDYNNWQGNKQTLVDEMKNIIEQKGRFMSSVSHELRTPLNGIIGERAIV